MASIIAVATQSGHRGSIESITSPHRRGLLRPKPVSVVED